MLWVEQWRSAELGRIAICVAGAYLLGCFATGYYLVRARTGRDIRELASGSVGARNVGRALGRMFFFLTVLGDFAKGALAVWAVERLTGNQFLAGLALLAVVAGHIWPAQLGFRGGKGVATSLGGLLFLDPHLALVYVVVFVVGFAVIRKTILPGLFAYVCLPLACLWPEHDGTKTGIFAALAAMVLFAHRRNFVEEIPWLAARYGEESKITKP